MVVNPKITFKFVLSATSFIFVPLKSEKLYTVHNLKCGQFFEQKTIQRVVIWNYIQITRKNSFFLF